MIACIVLIFMIVGSDACQLKGVTCLNSTVYQHCRVVNGITVLFGDPQDCPSGYGCHETIGYYPCIQESLLPTTTTTTPRPTCDNSDLQNKKRPYYNSQNVQDCSKYAICLQNWWWWEERIVACPDNTGFSWESKECTVFISPETCETLDITTTTTTTERPVTNCDLSENQNKLLPYWEGNVQNCSRYTQCEKNWWWFDLVVYSCPENTGFHAQLQQCVSYVDPTTCLGLDGSSTTTQATTTSKPSCDNPVYQNQKRVYSDVNGQSCSKYLICEQNWWWWEERTKSCSQGTGFSAVLNECVEYINPETCVDSRTTIPTTTTTASTTTVPTTTTTEKPNCDLAQYQNKKRQYTSTSGVDCSKYAICEQNWWWWEEHIKSCPDGTGFSAELLDCVEYIDPNTCLDARTTTTTTTTSTTTETPTTTIVIVNCDDSNYQNKKRPYYDDQNQLNCAKYAICEKNWWWWEEHVLDCPTGTGFFVGTNECIAAINPTTCRVLASSTRVALKKLS